MHPDSRGANPPGVDGQIRIIWPRVPNPNFNASTGQHSRVSRMIGTIGSNGSHLESVIKGIPYEWELT